MKIAGLILLVIGALFSFGASLLVKLVTKQEEPSEQNILNTKLFGLLVAAGGLLLVFLG